MVGGRRPRLQFISEEVLDCQDWHVHQLLWATCSPAVASSESHQGDEVGTGEVLVGRFRASGRLPMRAQPARARGSNASR
jgi:hypothetical protein